MAVVEAVVAGDPVYVSSTADRVGKADAGATAKARVIGIAETSQPTPPGTTVVVSNGIVTGILSGAGVAGTPYYLQAGGGIGTSIPGSGNRVIEVGFALNTNDLWARIVDYGKKA
jgi:hypothetical protein